MTLKSRPPVGRSLAAVFVACCVALLLRAADTPPSPPKSLAQALEGVWVHVGEPGNVSPAPSASGRLKFRINGRWTFTTAERGTGVVRAHFGGTYTVRGDEYIETIDYSTDVNDPELKRSMKFTVKVEGDTMTQIGIGNPYTEVWKRVR